MVNSRENIRPLADRYVFFSFDTWGSRYVEAHSVLTLVQNICLLLAAALLFDVVVGRWFAPRPKLGQLASGLGLGLIGMLIMVTPWSPAPGIFIDTRAVLLGLSGLFFGAVPTAVAVLITGTYRLALGGVGAWAGVGLIVLAGGTGVVWRHFRKGPLYYVSWLEFFLLGVVLLAELLLMLLTLPRWMPFNVLQSVAAAVFLLFPICTMLGGKFLTSRMRWHSMERLLREREEMFSKTFSEHQAVQILLDPGTGMIRDANKAAEKFYGWTCDELRGKSIFEINSLPKERLVVLLQRARFGTQSRFNFQHYLADGSLRYVEVFSSRISVQGKEIVHSIIHDVTGRKQAEEALLESENRLHLAVDGTGLGLWDWNPLDDGLIFNERWAEMLGYTLAELEPVDVMTWRDRCHPDDLVGVDQSLHDHFEGNREFFEQEVRMVHRDGRLLWMLVRGKVVEYYEGRPARMLGTMEDITERRRHREEIEREVERRRILMDNSNDGILIVDQEHRIVETNHRFAEMLGYAEEELIGMQTWEYEANYDEAGVRKDFDDLSSVNLFMETRHVRKDGTTFDVELSLSGSEVMGERLVMAIVRDISERKQVQAALEMEKERAEAANQSKSEFLANMSHEIRTPLNGILGMLQLLQSSSLDDEQSEYVRTAVQSSRRLNRLLTDVLDLSRVEAGKLSLEIGPFNLSEDIDQVCEMFNLSGQSGAELLCRVDPSVPGWLSGDSNRLMQIFINLIGNAFKFTSEGSIEVAAEEIHTTTDKARVLFSVSDSGLGIPLDKLGSLFSPFTQAHEGYTRQFQGAGLGLSICRRLVELMGGSICIDSVVGEGTMVFFVLELPVVSSEEAAGTEPAVETPYLPLNILLAEDDRVNHLATRRLLENDGHMVAGVENGKEALVRLRKETFDLVLMDIQMPVLNGMDAAQAIRKGEAGEACCDVPIIALTAYAMAEDMERILSSGMDGYLTKPMNIEELRKELARIGK
ncbi:PAS domain S-box protein [Pseudodesulfovibrio sp.]|uniref:PAS domain S-box protein n=1 Tax=unclassified Pseudodesulfovibrio TaxID=2661612 RepID=UPI003B0071A3